MVLNADIARRLADAQHALEEVEAAHANGGAQLPARAKGELDALRAEKTELEARGVAYRKLVNEVQALLDSGRVRATMDNGHVKFFLPRAIDTADPWSH
jgi:hypothetical protein